MIRLMIKRIFMKKYIMILIGLCLFGSVSAQESAQQILAVSLGQILSIESVKVEGVTYHKNEPMYNVTIKTANKSNPDVYSIELSPMIVKVHTNLATPIYVRAEFLELKQVIGPYRFPNKDLGFSPSTCTIHAPYDGVETGQFTPIAKARPNTIAGDYVGKILFTLGAI